jgi:hypothetical protein
MTSEDIKVCMRIVLLAGGVEAWARDMLAMYGVAPYDRAELLAAMVRDEADERATVGACFCFASLCARDQDASRSDAEAEARLEQAARLAVQSAGVA